MRRTSRIVPRIPPPIYICVSVYTYIEYSVGQRVWALAHAVEPQGLFNIPYPADGEILGILVPLPLPRLSDLTESTGGGGVRPG